MINLYDLSLDELTDFVVDLGEKQFRAKQLWNWLYNKRVDNFEAMTSLSKSFIATLKANAVLGTLELVTQQNSNDGTQKRLYRLHDGQLIESVLMP